MRLLVLLKLFVLLLPLAVGAQASGGNNGEASTDSTVTVTAANKDSLSPTSLQVAKSTSGNGTGISKADFAALPTTANPKKPSRNADLEGIVLTYQMDFLRGLPESVAYRQLRSGGFSFTLYFNQKFGRSGFSYAAGAGLSARNYFSNLRDWQTGAVWPDSPEIKNKHVFTTYELVPLELRYTKRMGASGKTFKISAGFNVGYTGSLSRKSVLGSLMEKYKGRTDMIDLDPWRTAIIGRVGYHRFGISAYYGLNDWFRTNTVNARPWSLGVSLLL